VDGFDGLHCLPACLPACQHAAAISLPGPATASQVVNVSCPGLALLAPGPYTLALSANYTAEPGGPCSDGTAASAPANLIILPPMHISLTPHPPGGSPPCHTVTSVSRTVNYTISGLGGTVVANVAATASTTLAGATCNTTVVAALTGQSVNE
jgi:hypothetical protein